MTRPHTRRGRNGHHGQPLAVRLGAGTRKSIMRLCRVVWLEKEPAAEAQQPLLPPKE